MTPEIEWFVNLCSRATRRAYEAAIADFMCFGRANMAITRLYDRRHTG